MRRFLHEHGGTVLMMLVVFGMILTMTTAVIFFAQRQLKATVNQEQTERAFQVAEAGVEYTLFLLNANVYTIEELPNLYAIEQPVNDDILHEPSGTFSITFASPTGVTSGKAVQVTSQGRDTAEVSCEEIVATIERISNRDSVQYEVTSWDHLPECS